jgi:hypothetical protein
MTIKGSLFPEIVYARLTKANEKEDERARGYLGRKCLVHTMMSWEERLRIAYEFSVIRFYSCLD